MTKSQGFMLIGIAWLILGRLSLNAPDRGGYDLFAAITTGVAGLISIAMALAHD